MVTESVDRPISRRKLCSSCAIENMVTATAQMAAGQGEYFDRWQTGIRKAALDLVNSTDNRPGVGGGTYPVEAGADHVDLAPNAE